MHNLTQNQREQLKIKDNRIDFYFKVENTVIDDDSIFSNIYESHLFIILSRYCNNGQVAFPSYNTLAQKCYCSKRTIINAMNSLIEKGLVNKIGRKKENSNENDTNFYTVNNINKYEMKDKEKIGGAYGALPSESHAPEVVNEVHHPSASGAPKKEQDINNKNKKNNTKKHVVLFDKFFKQIEKSKTNQYIGKFLSEKNINDLFKITDNDFILTKLFDILYKTQIQVSNFNYIKGILNNLLSEQETIDQVQNEKRREQEEKLREEKIQAELEEKESTIRNEELNYIKNQYKNLSIEEKEELEKEIEEAYKTVGGEISSLEYLKKNLYEIYENTIASILVKKIKAGNLNCPKIFSLSSI